MSAEQTLFDRVWNHFITEGNPASFDINAGNAAVPQYRSGGNACAIGIFLTDKIYSPMMEGTTVEQIVTCRFDVDSQADFMLYVGSTRRAADWFKQYDINFLEQLQECHDDAVRETVEACGGAKQFNRGIFEIILAAHLMNLAKQWELVAPFYKCAAISTPLEYATA